MKENEKIAPSSTAVLKHFITNTDCTYLPNDSLQNASCPFMRNIDL